MIRRPPRSTQSRSSAASDVYKRQGEIHSRLGTWGWVRRRLGPDDCLVPSAVGSRLIATMLNAYTSQRQPHPIQLRTPRLSRLWVWIAWLIGLGALALLLALAPLTWGILVVCGATGAIILLLLPEVGLYLIAFTIPFGSLYPLTLGSI